MLLKKRAIYAAKPILFGRELATIKLSPKWFETTQPFKMLIMDKRQIPKRAAVKAIQHLHVKCLAITSMLFAVYLVDGG